MSASGVGGVLVGDDGVPVGHDPQGRALLLGLHRAAPYDVLLIGGLWTARILALRADAAGLRVAVETARPRAWGQLDARAAVEGERLDGVGREEPDGGGGSDGANQPHGADGASQPHGAGNAGQPRETSDAGQPHGADGPGQPRETADAGRLELFGVGRVPVLGAAEGRPVLVVRDCGMRPPRGRVVPAAWQSVLTLLPYLSPVAPRLIRDSALIGVQRVSPDEARRIGRLLALTPEEADALPDLGDGVTLWCAGRDRHWVTTTATGGERELIGPARRMD